MSDSIKSMNLSVVILSGGNSKRMGEPKAFLQNNEEKSFLESIINLYDQFGIKDIIVVLNSNLRYNDNIKNIAESNNIHICYNKYPEYGRFYSCQLGIAKAKKKNAVFLHNIDIPSITPSTLESLVLHNKKNSYVVPVYNSMRGHPILISTEIAKNIINESLDNNLKHYLKRYKQTNVEVDDKDILSNINTKEEYALFIKSKNHVSHKITNV